MCGIAGILNWRTASTPSEDVVGRMVALLRHRGPDETGLYLDDHICMGQCRLSIIGISTGTQPICNEDGSLWIVYNGEVFNYIELKTELISRGHRFRTDTDTEVIVHLYEDFGPDCLNHLNGQFAFAIWNAATEQLFLARDRVGILPLYYTQTADAFIFSSEIKAILAHPAVARRLDAEALFQTFTFWAPLAPKTAFENIYQLPPGHSMKVSDRELRVKPYWSLPAVIQAAPWRGTLDEACEELRALLIDAARLRLRADVPVGAYLSGGLDSSYITAIVRRHFQNHLRTFSMTFADANFDESSYQREMIAALGTDHSSFHVTDRHIHDAFVRVIWHCETPLLRTAPAPLYLLADLVRKSGYKVVLTGEGADEIFGGYDIFKEAKIRSFWARAPASRLRPLLLQKIYPDVFAANTPGAKFLEKYFSVTSADLDDPLLSHRIRWKGGEKNTLFFADDLLARVAHCRPEAFIDPALLQSLAGRDALTRAQALEIYTFLSSYLLSSQGDRVSMAHGIEIRPPFLDHRVIEFGFRLPPAWRMNGLNEKYLLKKAAAGTIPPVISQRVKKPYRAPARSLLSTAAPNQHMEEFLSEHSLKRFGYFKPAQVSRLLDRLRHLPDNTPGEAPYMALLGIISTQMMHEQFIERFPPTPLQSLQPTRRIDRRSGNHEQASLSELHHTTPNGRNS